MIENAFTPKDTDRWCNRFLSGKIPQLVARRRRKFPPIDYLLINRLPAQAPDEILGCIPGSAKILARSAGRFRDSDRVSTLRILFNQATCYKHKVGCELRSNKIQQ